MAEAPPLSQPKRNFWYTSWTFRTAHRLALGLPRPLSRIFAALIGHLAFDCCHDRRELMCANLQIMTGLAGPQLMACGRENFVKFLQMIPDSLSFAHGDADEARGLLESSDGLEHIHASISRGKGTVLVTGHLGAWELGAILLAINDIPITVVTQEEPLPELGQWRERYREKFGIRTITVGSDPFAFVEIVKTLRNNGIVALLVDRPYGEGGIPVTMAGRQTLFSPAPTLLWQHTGATILPAFVFAKDGGRYHCTLLPPIEMQPYEDAATFQQKNTQLIADLFASLIRENPTQWYNYFALWT